MQLTAWQAINNIGFYTQNLAAAVGGMLVQQAEDVANISARATAVAQRSQLLRESPARVDAGQYLQRHARSDLRDVASSSEVVPPEPLEAAGSRVPLDLTALDSVGIPLSTGSS